MAVPPPVTEPAGGAPAEDQRQSVGSETKPAKTGLYSIFVWIFLNSLELRTQWSKDSSCQNGCPLCPKKGVGLAGQLSLDPIHDAGYGEMWGDEQMDVVEHHDESVESEIA
jgi:hypothetical protein